MEINDNTQGTGRKALAEGIAAGVRGDYEAALGHFEEALASAHAAHNQDLWDRVFCNRSVAQLRLGRAEECLAELRRIVLRSADPETSFLAAYTTACTYELARDYDRALFYAGLARDRSIKLSRLDWLSWCHNQLGNIRLAQSYFDQACDDYELALKLMALEPSLERAGILDNLGYCRFVQGRYHEGFSLLIESLRTFIRFGADRDRVRAALTLSYGYLEIGKLRPALRHANYALARGERFGDDGLVKKAHYLLGEIYQQMGRSAEARDHFTRLQQQFFPGAPNVPELLMALDVRALVNLKA